jgi:hypothetical protein
MARTAFETEGDPSSGPQAADAPAGGLNANHRRMLEATFGHTDKLLAEIELLATTRSPLARILPDLTPVQVQVILDAVVRARQHLVEATRSLVGRLPDSAARASWSIRTHLTMADVGLEEITTGRRRQHRRRHPRREGPRRRNQRRTAQCCPVLRHQAADVLARSSSSECFGWRMAEGSVLRSAS